MACCAVVRSCGTANYRRLQHTEPRKSGTTHLRFCAIPWLRRSASSCPAFPEVPRLAGRGARADQVGPEAGSAPDYSCAAPIERVGAEAAVALGDEEGGCAGAVRGGEERQC
jgi:hypothetical protein